MYRRKGDEKTKHFDLENNKNKSLSFFHFFYEYFFQFFYEYFFHFFIFFLFALYVFVFAGRIRWRLRAGVDTKPLLEGSQRGVSRRGAAAERGVRAGGGVRRRDARTGGRTRAGVPRRLDCGEGALDWVAARRGVAWGRVGECGRGRQRVQGRDGGLQ